VLLSYYLCCSVIICVVRLLFVLFGYYLCCSVIICVVRLLFVLFGYYLCYSMYCLRVNGYWTTSTGCLQIAVDKYIISYQERCPHPATFRTYLLASPVKELLPRPLPRSLRRRITFRLMFKYILRSQLDHL
jgi:hypothetical protein